MDVPENGASELGPVMTPALRSILGEIGKWGAIGLFLILFVYYFETLKSAAVGTVAGPVPAGSQPAAARTPHASSSRNPAANPTPDFGSQRGSGSYSGDRRLNLPSGGYSAEPSTNYNYLNRTAPPNVSAGPTVTLQARGDGHFYAPVRLNGRPVETVVDTGATSVALSYEDAAAAGIYVGDSDFTLRTLTANGIARAAPVMIDRIELDGITVRNVRATVAEPGRLHITLLGMSFLGKLARFEMRGRTMILHN